MKPSDKPLLVELRTEDMPPLLLDDVASSLAANLVKELARVRLCASGAENEHWSTPRRIAVLVQNVTAKSAATAGLRRGPSVKNAYDSDGKPTAALSGFLRSCGAKQKNLQEIDYKGQPYVAIPQSSGGEPIGALLGPTIERAVAQIIAPRLMRWGAGGHSFVRPIRGVCAIHGTKPVKAKAFGAPTLPHSLGHRFLAPGKVRISDAVNYAAIMHDHKVIVDPAKRRAVIAKQAKEKAPRVRLNEELMLEVSNMCEWPKCYLGKFDTQYQKLPDKIIETCMGKHLRSFAVGASKLKNEFVFVADNEPPDDAPLPHNIQRVMRARLADTLFIYEQDLKATPEDLLARLDNISYLQGMGSMRARCERIRELAVLFSFMLRSGDGPEIPDLAAQYIKADLGTLLVDEYPSLEGHVGAALLPDLPKEARELIRSHLDRSVDGDWTNPSRDALVLALELERLVSITAISGLPKGSRDPQGLRRAMGRVLRILQRYRSVDLNELLSSAWDVCHAAAAQHGALEANRFSADGKKLLHDLKRYAVRRVVNMASDLLNQDFDRRLLNAVEPPSLRACDKGVPINITNFLKRIEGLKKFMDTKPEKFKRMLATAKRLNNMGGKENPDKIDERLFDEKEEHDLYEACRSWKDNELEFALSHDYDSYYNHAVEIAPKVDKFFDNVMVNVEKDSVRENRLNLVRLASGLLNAAVDTRSLYS